jgi:hypothetical protein
LYLSELSNGEHRRLAPLDPTLVARSSGVRAGSRRRLRTEQFRA